MNAFDPSPANCWQSVLRGVEDAWPADRYRDVGVVVGVSGGADSVALLRALAELRRRDATNEKICDPRGFLVVAHYHHRVRGEDADGDQRFVEQIASEHRLEFATAKAETVCHDEAGMSAARTKFLITTAKKFGARYVAVAHSREDNVETLLHHLMRGTGPSGLAAMGSPKPIDEDLVLMRPMLGVARQVIREGLVEIGQPWREDETNQSMDYARNWIRHELLPKICSRYPDAVKAMSRAIEGQRQWRRTIEDQAQQWLDLNLQSHDPVTFRRSATVDPSIVIAALQRFWQQQSWSRQAMTQAHWKKLSESLLIGPQQRFTLPGQIVVTANDDRITLTRQDPIGHQR